MRSRILVTGCRRITRIPSRKAAQKSKSACHPVPAECQALLGKTIRQLFAFACPSYPCSGFPEPNGALTTHRPLGSRNSSPMTYPSGCGRQYATRARDRNPPGNDSMFRVSLMRQRRTLETPRSAGADVLGERRFHVGSRFLPGNMDCHGHRDSFFKTFGIENLRHDFPFPTSTPRCAPAPGFHRDAVSFRTARGPRIRKALQSFRRRAGKPPRRR